MQRYVIGLIAFAVGVLLLCFRNPLATWMMKIQSGSWGLEFGQREIKITEIILVLASMLLTVFGLLTLFGVIDFK